MMRITETVKHLIIINVIFWIATLALAERNIDLVSLFALYFPENPTFKFWQPVSSMFMHSVSSPMHILFNMIGLWMFGSALEMRWGKVKFLCFYMITGVGAALVHTLVNYYGLYSNMNILVEAGFSQTEILDLLKEGMYNPNWKNVLTDAQFNTMVESFLVPALGASGALYGVLVAFGMLYPNMELMMLFIPIPIKAKYFIPGLLVYDFISGIAGSTGLFGGGNIAHFAHLGGALFGFLLMWYWNKTQFNQNRWDR
ncbi:rhomboid family intramembrane serine protease [Kordia jejudonensis]|uniref:rhomboid family intramembrane serine protease n=1 Tax=Kordia jejudonensis TaxID=1348245 RepID=UPI001569CA6A|nr:rhomboid family intramembrane serine protease [Kordia jejudonensis]